MAGIKEVCIRLLDVVFSFYEAIGDAVYVFYVEHSRTLLDSAHVLFDRVFYVLLFFTFLLTFGYFVMALVLALRKPKDVAPLHCSDDMLPTVTIQIPTYNELAALACAKRCLAFDYPKDKVQIIIGDDSSEESVSRQIDAFARDHQQILVTRRGSNVGFKPGNLNHMLPHSTGDYIVIFDSDFLPNTWFLRRIIAPFFTDKRIAAVQARWKIVNFSQNLSSLVGGTIPLYTHYLGLPFLKMLDSNGFIAGSAEAIRKKDLIELGGWASGCHTEDIEYSLRLTRANKRIVYLENLTCGCEAPFTVRDVCRQQMRWAYGVITACKRHFVPLVRSKNVRPRDKVNIFLLLSGYVVTLLFFSLTIAAMLSLLTHRPEPVLWVTFFSEMIRNVLFTSGYLFATSIALVLGNKVSEIPRLILASFSVGLVVIVVVTQGVYQALVNRPMEWFMLKKKGNTVITHD